MNHQDLCNLVSGDQLVDLFVEMAVAVNSPTGMIVPESMEKIHDRILLVAFAIGRRQKNGIFRIPLKCGTIELAKLNSRPAAHLNGAVIATSPFTSRLVLKLIRVNISKASQAAKSYTSQNSSTN